MKMALKKSTLNSNYLLFCVS